MNQADRSIRAGLFLLVALNIVYMALVFHVERRLIFDDAFIDYRYSKNLVQGHGITWNANEPPTEGYTSFLHVIVMAPFIALGVDPYAASKALNMLGGLGLSVLVGIIAKRQFGASNVVSALSGMSCLTASNTYYVSTIGMETVYYTFLLCASFFYASRLMDRWRAVDAAACFALQVLVFWGRPEGLLFTVAFVAALFLYRRETGVRLGEFIKAAAWFVIPFSAYIAWKLVHFGDIFPNPFYIKAASHDIVRSLGLNSIINYATMSSKVIAMALVSLAVPLKGAASRRRALCLIFIFLYCGFYLHVDTLMDLNFRFLYPVTPFVVYLALPVTVGLLRHLVEWRKAVLLKLPVFVLAYIFVFFYNPIDPAVVVKDSLRNIGRYSDSDLRYKRYLRSQILATYPDIRNILIAYGDAGVLPYFTEAPNLDEVGLNDTFIARETGLGKLVDYYFGREPVLAVVCSNKDSTWYDDGHGPMGDFTKWYGDPRWDRYTYAGTMLADQYDLNFFILDEYEKIEDLKAFLIEKNIADLKYNVFPLPLGSRYRGV